MKKTLLLKILLLALLLCSATALADAYVLLEDGTAMITRASCYKSWNVPETVDGHPVTAIGDFAAQSEDYLETVTIPDYVTSIGENPFRFCNKLKEIVVSPEHPTLAVVDGVLYSKPDKRLVCVPPGLKKRAVAIPKGIRIIGAYAFGGNDHLKNLDIPDTVEVIGTYAFYLCNWIEEIVLPNSVTTIGDRAFLSCSSLERLNIPNSVREVGINPFGGSENLKLKISSNHPALTYSNGALYSKADKRLVCQVKRNATSLSIAKGTEIIGEDACAFAELRSITIPNTVKRIENGALSSFELRSITIPSSVTYIGDEAFSFCGYLKSVTVPASVTHLGARAFERCSELKKADIRGPIETIGPKTFSDCAELSSVTLPETLREIGESAFERTYLGTVKLPEGLTTIGAKAFSAANLKTITIPDSVTEIGPDAFKNNPDLIVKTENEYAKQYCRDNKVPLAGDDSLDWLK
ncbi:MAG: leucine-rich repeat domain-containing protein [Clostridia bacterium]|nr:leucine-rich repeat domain-containing protein [Clostridia bacterium]